MDATNPCPMCGATIGTDTARCLHCGESFAPTIPQRPLLRIPVNMDGVLPGWIAGTAAYLVFLMVARISSTGFEISPAESVVGILLSVTAGGLIGSAIAAGWRAFRNTWGCSKGGTPPRL